MSKIIKGTPEEMQKSDYHRFYKKDATGFSPERNKAIVEQTIREAEAMQARKMKEYEEAYAERSDAVISYLKSLERGGASSNIEKYFGKKELARLRGLEIKRKLMEKMRVMDKNGNIISPADYI